VCGYGRWLPVYARRAGLNSGRNAAGGARQRTAAILVGARGLKSLRPGYGIDGTIHRLQASPVRLKDLEPEMLSNWHSLLRETILAILLSTAVLGPIWSLIWWLHP
jgi:hypothetical protein